MYTQPIIFFIIHFKNDITCPTALYPTYGMNYDMYDVYFQIFTVLALFHVSISVMKFVISVCEKIDTKPNIDERLDVLEQTMIELLSGMYTSEEPPRNTITTTVVPVRRPAPMAKEDDDIDMSSDTEKED